MNDAVVMRILTVEDESVLSLVISRHLEDEFGASVDTAPDCASARELLSSNTYDLITLDHQLPDGDGLSLLQEIIERDGAPPVIMVTGHGDEETAVSAFKIGASGYVVKDTRMSTMLVEEARSALARAGLKKADRASRASQERLERLTAATPTYIFEIDRNGVITFVNRTFEGKANDDVAGTKLVEWLPEEHRTAVEELIERVYRTNEAQSTDYSTPDPFGYERTYLVSLTPVTIGEEVTSAVLTASDVTKRVEAEASYRTLFESSIDGIVFVNMEGDIVSANRAYADMLGYTGGELRKITYVQLTPERHHEMEEEIVRTQVLPRGYSDLYDKEYIRKDGTVFPVSLRTWLVKDGAGNPTGMWAIVRDVTERKRADEALRKSEKRYRLMVENLNEGIWMISAEAETLYVNDHMAEMLGYTVEEMVGKSLYEFMDEDGRSIAEENMRRREQGVKEQHDFVFIKNNGDRLYATLETSAITNDDGEFTGALAAVMDITERKVAEEALLRANTELEKYSHSMSHDLKGRLSSIMQSVGLLAERLEKTGLDDSADTFEVIKAIESDTHAACGTVNALLTLAQEGKRPTPAREVDVGKVVREAVSGRNA